MVPSAWVITSVPQKAKEVLVDPVLLFIASTNVRVNVVPGLHELHKSPPVRVALTNSRSLEVHDEGEGKVVVVWAIAENPKRPNTVKRRNFLKSAQWAKNPIASLIVNFFFMVIII